MLNPLKLKLRIKIIVAIVLALLISFLFIKPKENDIPVLPISMKLDLQKQNNNTFSLNDVTVVTGYAPDYQNDFQSNFYKIEIKKDKKVLFTGKMFKQNIVIHEWLYENPRATIEEIELKDFDLYLPYYKEATQLIITEDSGQEVLNVDLKSKKLIAPKLQNTCGDGICTDNENLLMCYTDCKYLLPNWISN